VFVVLHEQQSVEVFGSILCSEGVSVHSVTGSNYCTCLLHARHQHWQLDTEWCMPSLFHTVSRTCNDATDHWSCLG